MQLIFGDEKIIHEVYKGKENLIKKPKPTKKRPPVFIDENDFKKYLLAKNYVEIIDGQMFYNYNNLVKKVKNGYINLNIKDIRKDYLDNLKQIKKYLAYKKKILFYADKPEQVNKLKKEIDKITFFAYG